MIYLSLKLKIQLNKNRTESIDLFLNILNLNEK